MMHRIVTMTVLIGGFLVSLLAGHSLTPPAAEAFGEVEYNGVKYFCVLGEPWTLINVCVYIETDYTNSPNGLDLSNQGDVFPLDLGSGPGIIRDFLEHPAMQDTTIGWSLPTLNPLVPGSAGVLNGDAEVRCATGRIAHLAITWDGDIHADLGPVTDPSISPLVNAHNSSSELISQPALVVEIPVWDRALFPNLGALRGNQLVRICGRWVADTNGDEQWAELHPATSVTILEPPIIDAHSNVGPVEATSAAGAVVGYTAPATHDAVDGTGVATCTPASGSTFALGATTVTCSAIDSAGNTATPTSFTVTVQDTTPPALTVPGPITAEATGAAGATVSFTASAVDLVDGTVPVTCSPASGSSFSIAATTSTTTQVSCTAKDAHGNVASKQFPVTVQDTTPPVVTVPTSITAEATSAAGAVVTFTASASDLVDGNVAALCTPASGATFGINPTTSKTTTVNCSATDAHGNTATKSFQVTVQDTTPPVVSVPAAMTVDATSPAGAIVTFTTSATDAVDGSDAVSCTPASGTTFAIGTTTVACSASDAHGNKGQASFTVHVAGAAEQLQNLKLAVTGVGPGTSLADKVQAVLSAVQAGNTALACGNLTAFKNEVTAQSGKQITLEQAQQFQTAAGRIGAVLGC